jgi:hypothetical protein
MANCGVKCMSSVEADIIWAGSRGRAEALLAAISPDGNL